MNVLVVDDSVVMRKSVMSALKEMGHEVAGEATDGKEAIEQHRKLSPDAVTMDITMPVMDGVEATRLIREEFPTAKIIMVTSMEQKEMVLGAIMAGAICYVVKPIDKDTLRECLERAQNM